MLATSSAVCLDIRGFESHFWILFVIILCEFKISQSLVIGLWDRYSCSESLSISRRSCRPVYSILFYRFSREPDRRDLLSEASKRWPNVYLRLFRIFWGCLNSWAPPGKVTCFLYYLISVFFKWILPSLSQSSRSCREGLNRFRRFLARGSLQIFLILELQKSSESDLFF